MRNFENCKNLKTYSKLRQKFIVLGVVWGEAETCNSCGSECQSACGTRHFRTCCFNYLKKRSNPEPPPSPLDPSLKLELWLAKSKYPYFQSRSAFLNEPNDFLEFLGNQNDLNDVRDTTV